MLYKMMSFEILLTCFDSFDSLRNFRCQVLIEIKFFLVGHHLFHLQNQRYCAFGAISQALFIAEKIQAFPNTRIRRLMLIKTFS